MQARVHSYAERHEAALAVLRPAVTPEVARPDAQLQLGRTALAAGEREVARDAFARAAVLEPGSGDAWLGLGDVARSEGVINVAQLNYERALVVPETASVARERIDSLVAEQRRFELSTDFSFSRFNNDSDDWREGGISLTWRIDESRQLTGGLAVANRYGSTDIQAAGVWNGRLDERSGYFLGAALTPAADFLPSWQLRGGLDRELFDLTGQVGRLGVGVGFVELSLAEYEDGLVQGFDLGLVQYGWEGRVWLTAKAGGSLGTSGSFDPNYGLRLDWQLTPASRLFGGFGQSYDNSTQGMGTTESYFVGFDHWLTDRFGMVLSLALEDRDNGVRQTTAAVGFRVRF
ncbi:MAG: YaiO family outer membrane beta-barrel protein [Geminicoccaceae bacterium]